MNVIQREDIRLFADSFEFAGDLSNSSFLITGSTGLIGSTFIHCLIALNKGVKIIAPVRNLKKAETLFSPEELSFITLIKCDILTFDYEKLGAVDYIVHCAAPTASKFFVEYPVETFDIIYSGTKVLLDYARKCPVKGFVNLSSLEVYGTILNDSNVITEEVQGYLDPMSLRSSYPMSKRAAENLCCLYAKQYEVPVKVARLTQTTGAGLAKDDNRIIAQFARLIAKGQDIVLHTTGEAARPYCYTTDAISAILYILLRGKAGEAYNVANENTYISAKDMAEYLRDNFNSSIKVRIELNEDMGYAPVTKLRLSTEKLKALGWCPSCDLQEIFRRLLASFA